MGYANEFPHGRTWDSDLRQLLELFESVNKLPNEWSDFKANTIKYLAEQVKLYFDGHIDDLIQKYVYDITYNAETETISYIRKDGN